MILLPFPPSINRYWRSVPGKGVLISEEGRVYRRAVGCACIEQRVRRVAGPLAVEIVAHTPDARKRDLDNLLKATLDSLTHAGAWEDDSQIKDLRILWGEPCKPGSLEVTIKPMDRK